MRIRWLFGGVALAVSGLFAVFLWPAVRSALPETDLWWMLPTLSHWMAQRSPLQGAVFLLAPSPTIFEQPLLKLSLWGMYSFLGCSYPALILLGLLVHGVNAVLVFHVGRQIGLEERVSLFSALVYLTFFAQFHAYFWPSALQHLLAVATLLGMVSLYLAIEERFRTGHPRRGFLLNLTFGLVLLGALQRSTIILLVILMTHILFSPGSLHQRLARFDRWVPLFLFYPIYLLLGLCYVGDSGLNTAIVTFPFLAPVTVGALWLLLAFGLFGLRALIRFSAGPEWRRIRWPLLGTGVAGALLALALRDHREVFFPYNALVPLCASLTSFLDPFRTVFAMDSTQPYHVIPPMVSLPALLLTVGMVWFFARLHSRRRSEVALLLAWYGACVGYLLLHRHVVSSFPIRIPSRYFVYWSPVFAWIFCAVTWDLLESGAKRLGWGQRAREWVWVTVLTALCLTNVAAIRLQLFRGRLANTYFIYDDFRTAQLVRDDWIRRNGAGPPERLGLQRVVEMALAKSLQRYVPVDRIGFDNLRDRMKQAFGVRSIGWLHLNEAPDPRVDGEYDAGGVRVLDGAGRDLDEFSRQVEAGLKDFRAGDLEEARNAWTRAADLRPFLFRTLLPGYPLSDLRWVTDGRGFLEWLDEVEWKWRTWSVAPVEKWEHTRAVVRQELSDFAICLCGLSTIENRSGNQDQARRWLSQLYFLENHPGRLRAWLETDERIRGLQGLSGALEGLSSPAMFGDPLPWQKDDYGAGRFLIRLLTGIEIRSQWDRECGTAGL